jgi:hypothetical protein
MFNFEVSAYLFEIKKGGLTTGIHVVFRGLKFESDADIGQISADFERERFEIGSFGLQEVIS